MFGLGNVQFEAVEKHIGKMYSKKIKMVSET